LREKWLLDASIRDDKVVLSLYDEENHAVKEHETELVFHGYIISENPISLAEEIGGLDGVVSSLVEKFRIPPYYVDTVDVVVFKTKSYRLLRKLLNQGIGKGLKPVNNYPHPLVEALYRAGIRPLTRVNVDEKNTPATVEWHPADKDPAVDYVVLRVEHGYFVAETPSGENRFWELRDVAEFIVSNKFLLAFTDELTYLRLIEAEPSLARKVYRWVTGGGFHPSEYFEWSRLSYTPLSMMGNVSIGKILTTLEALLARDRKLLVDKTYGRREPWRTMRELLVYDRGGVVYQPSPGLYWRVCQVDFKSLYPSIIVKYNISGETVDKPSCLNRTSFHWSPHTVCMDEEGVVPGSIRRLIELKELYDELGKKTGEELYEYRKSAVKWILVASFGYLGYRNSLFGSVMAHELVTSTSRELMRRARLVVEEKGYRVIHAIVDSVFIQGVASPEECARVKELIEEATGFKAKVEAHYTWLYLPRDVKGLKGVANRYYGLLSSGELKAKGIMMVRGDTPILVKKAQYEALLELSKAVRPAEMASRLARAHAIIDSYVEKLRKGVFNVLDLVILRDAREGYVKPPAYVFEGEPPYRLVYVSGKLRYLEKMRSLMIDVNKYIELLEKARRELPSKKDVEALTAGGE